MNNIFRTIFLLKSLSTGLMLPIMSLMIISRGAGTELLPLVVGVYSLTVILFEFPSGVFSDIFGRKKTFLISCSLMLLSLFLLIVETSNVSILFLAFAIQGTGRAFSSGSLDALVLEKSLLSGEDASTAKTSGELGFIESLGIAVGSIFAGFLGNIGTTCSANLFVMALLYLLITLLTVVGVKDTHIASSGEPFLLFSEIKKFRRQMAGSLHFSMQSAPVRILLIQVFFTGIVLFSLETYWQPGLLRLMADRKLWIFGFVSFLGFCFTALASYLTPKLLLRISPNSNRPWWNFLFVIRLLFAAGTFLLGSILHPSFFVLAYLLIYFFHGGGSTVENTLLSQNTPSEMLAGIMSLFSLIFQLGALAASAFTGAFLSNADLPIIWLLLSGLAIFCYIALFLKARFIHSLD